MLSLDDDQVAAIDSVFRRRQVEVESAWQLLNRHLHSTVDSVHEEVMALLCPEQREAFERWHRGGRRHDGRDH